MINCSKWRHGGETGVVEPGDYVRILGKVRLWRDRREISIHSISKECNPQAESLHILEVHHLFHTVYNLAFHPPQTTALFKVLLSELPHNELE